MVRSALKREELSTLSINLLCTESLVSSQADALLKHEAVLQLQHARSCVHAQLLQSHSATERQQLHHQLDELTIAEHVIQELRAAAQMQTRARAPHRNQKRFALSLRAGFVDVTWTRTIVALCNVQSIRSYLRSHRNEPTRAQLLLPGCYKARSALLAGKLARAADCADAAAELSVQGRHADAIAQLRVSLQLRYAAYGRADLRCALSERELAVMHAKRTDHAQALPSLQSVLQCQRRLLTAGDISMVETSRAMADSQFARGNGSAARQLRANVVRDTSAALGPGHLATAAAQHALGAHCFTQRAFKASQQAHTNALRVRSLGYARARGSELGAGHILSAFTRFSLAQAVSACGDHHGALQLLQSCPPSLVDTAQRVAVVPLMTGEALISLRRYREALPYLTAAVTARVASLGMLNTRVAEARLVKAFAQAELQLPRQAAVDASAALQTLVRALDITVDQRRRSVLQMRVCEARHVMGVALLQLGGAQGAVLQLTQALHAPASVVGAQMVLRTQQWLDQARAAAVAADMQRLSHNHTCAVGTQSCSVGAHSSCIGVQARQDIVALLKGWATCISAVASRWDAQHVSVCVLLSVAVLSWCLGYTLAHAGACSVVDSRVARLHSKPEVWCNVRGSGRRMRLTVQSPAGTCSTPA